MSNQPTLYRLCEQTDCNHDHDESHRLVRLPVQGTVTAWGKQLLVIAPDVATEAEIDALREQIHNE